MSKGAARSPDDPRSTPASPSPGNPAPGGTLPTQGKVMLMIVPRVVPAALEATARM
jgi:hypothetical protein